MQSYKQIQTTLILSEDEVKILLKMGRVTHKVMNPCNMHNSTCNWPDKPEIQEFIDRLTEHLA